MRDTLRSLLETCAYALFAPVYGMFVLLLAAYFNVEYSVAGNITIICAIAPVITVWAIIMSKRATRNAEAQTQGFQTSPEKHARALDEYLQIIGMKKEEQTEK